MNARVLVVDDNLDLAENVADILADAGFDAVPVGSPIAALEEARTQAFECVVLDVRMPTMDGVELRERLRPVLPHASFVFMTAFASDDRLAAAARSGMVAILTKPFGPDSLVRLLRECVPDRPS